ncbi:MAG TPA: alpha-ribazole phosphatase [Firmicutes bacterium]|jgi:alpha-ribazole phosphatase|nr:alpha-ribazole phosphatase [Bacillota bacterium]
MLELILVRHGETDGNRKGTFVGWTDLELNATGTAQAYIIKDKLVHQTPDVVFASPLKRAYQTAEIINTAYGLDIQISDSLKERDFGLWDNLTLADIKANHPAEAGRWLTNPAHPIPGAENDKQFHQRIISFIDGLISSYPNSRILLVTHGGCIRTMITHLLRFKTEECWRFKVDTGSIAHVEVDEVGYAYLTMLNG